MIDQLLATAEIIAWILFVGGTLLYFLYQVFSNGIQTALLRLLSYRIIVPLLVAVGISILSAAVVFVQPQQVAVVISVISPRGIRPLPLPSGLHLIIPIVEREEMYPIYWQTYTMSGKLGEGAKQGADSIRARTSDGQEVLLDCSVIFRVDEQRAIRIHIDWQNRYIEDLVRPVVRGFVRTQVSQFTVEEVNSSSRKDLEVNLDRLLREEFADKGLILDQFVLRDIAFSPEFSMAVEVKQVAKQGEEQKQAEANQLRNLAFGQADKVRTEAAGEADAVVIQAQAEAERIKVVAAGEAEAILVKAQAQAEALKLISAALETNRDLLTYQYIDKLAPDLDVMLLPSDSAFLFPLPLTAPNSLSSSQDMLEMMRSQLMTDTIGVESSAPVTETQSTTDIQSTAAEPTPAPTTP